MKLITRINVTTELESNVLLPCLFDPDLFRSKLDINSSADWSHINTSVQHIAELKVNGESMFWNNRHGRIKAFSAQSGSLNFSILINKVQSSDLGLYQCELFRDINCSLAYTEISLALVEFSLFDNWQLVVAAAGGGLLLLCLISLCVYYTWIKWQALISSPVEHGSYNCQDNIPGQTDEVTYASIVHKPSHHQESEVLANKTPANASEFEHVNSESVLYAAVKRRDK
ncbi:uncharacterized protein LOC130228552 [Danio aesculapii]|uniref:uncharacterized protein LOC130228552 n=1 Tax=Danio aesculapii TaxID=1142201 RepID=UPI0024C0AD13|nr:uncharacterized protein LOC130228552 [Danio aesculapii]